MVAAQGEEKLALMTKAVGLLPLAHRATIRLLLEHFKRILDEEENRMDYHAMETCVPG